MNLVTVIIDRWDGDEHTGGTTLTTEEASQLKAGDFHHDPELDEMVALAVGAAMVSPPVATATRFEVRLEMEDGTNE